MQATTHTTPPALVQPDEADAGLTYVTSALDADSLAKLDLIIDTTLRTHPATEVQHVIDLVMRAGVELIFAGAAGRLRTGTRRSG